MSCDVISAVAEFVVGVLYSQGVILGSPMVCDVISSVIISAVTAFKGWGVALEGVILGFSPLLRLKRVTNSMPLGCPLSYHESCHQP